MVQLTSTARVSHWSDDFLYWLVCHRRAVQQRDRCLIVHRAIPYPQGPTECRRRGHDVPL